MIAALDAGGGHRSRLRVMLHLVADAAIAADDALGADDPNALHRAIDTLARNTDTARALTARIIDGRAA